MTTRNLFQSLTLVALPLAASISSFGATAKSSDPAQFDVPRWVAERTRIANLETDVDTQYANDKLLCRGDKACMHQAELKHAAGKRAVRIDTNNNNNIHAKAIVAAMRMQQRKNYLGADPKEIPENIRHFNVLTQLEQQELDVMTQRSNAEISCEGSSDSSCMANAEKAYQEGMDGITMQENTENGTHTKNLRNIRSGT